MNKNKKVVKFGSVLALGVVLSLGMFQDKQLFAEDEKHEKYEKDKTALLKALSQSKISLSEGIRQTAQGTEVPISAKFELDDKGQLSLSVYTAEKGLGVAPEKNVFKEISGSPTSAKWNPESEVIKDQGDLTKAKKQLMILSQGKLSLMDIVEKAKEHEGTMIVARPEHERGKFVCEVKFAKDGKVHEFHYDVVNGNEVKMNEREK